MGHRRLSEDTARALLPWVGFLTVATLALCERFAELPPAVAALAAARWVFGLRPASSPRP